MKFYTTFEVADILKVSEGTIREWIRKGKLGATRLGGTKTVRVSEQDINRFLEGNRVVAVEGK
ncbi:helix-turn-helix domain-containing protein [Chakrabartyella piscis]|uniref:helix-turn-helix domain-containing protein n=1 Tax=Chakrabartyella piscis TaxID=2918914 RepID=UPI00295844D6|nr:helix-turn-helix domain-containing protein [Chakrabartyella piscis]